METLSIPRLILVFLCFFFATTNATPSHSGSGPSATGEIVSTDHKVHNTVWPEFDFWKSATELGDRLKHTAEDRLWEASAACGVAAERVGEFKEAMSSVVDSVKALRVDITTQHVARGEPGARSPNLEDFEARFLALMEPVLEDFKAEFSVPLPEDQSERYKQRSMTIGRVLDKIEGAFVLVSGEWGMTEVDAKDKFGQLKPQLQDALDITGKLIDNHPVLFEVIIWTGVALIIPESWLLRPLLRAFGFGPLGPIKGTPAAWAQRFFWGGNVAEDSWFAICQRAGMKWTNRPFWRALICRVPTLRVIFGCGA